MILSEDRKDNLYCGIIMPIAAMSGYSVEHWIEVKNIIIEATKMVKEYNFKAEIVSSSEGEIDVIHKRIIQNVYNADILVCDISGKNPNVLFELGMRLAFDKPTILIKDDVTDFIFDTGVIEHLTYPKDLRYSKIIKFKSELANRIKQTYEKSIKDPDFSTFLGNFGKFKVPKLDQTAVSDVNQYIFDEISLLRTELTSVRKEIAAFKTSNKDRMSLVDLNETLISNLNEKFDMITLNRLSDEFRKISSTAMDNLNESNLYSTIDYLARIAAMLCDVINEALRGKMNTFDPQGYILSKLEAAKKTLPKN